MKLLLDQNISFRLVKLIAEDFPDAFHIKQVGLTDASDLEIREYSIKNQLTIVTYDDDFNKYNLLHGPPPKIIWIRKGNLSNKDLAELLTANKKQIEHFISSALPTDSGILEII